MVSRNDDPVQVEGTWDEILSRADDFVGRRVRVTVLREAPKSGATVGDQTLADVLRPLLEQSATLEREPSPRKLNGLSEEYAEAVVQQLRSQGLKT